MWNFFIFILTSFPKNLVAFKANRFETQRCDRIQTKSQFKKKRWWFHFLIWDLFKIQFSSNFDKTSRSKIRWWKIRSEKKKQPPPARFLCRCFHWQKKEDRETRSERASPDTGVRLESTCTPSRFIVSLQAISYCKLPFIRLLFFLVFHSIENANRTQQHLRRYSRPAVYFLSITHEAPVLHADFLLSYKDLALLTRLTLYLIVQTLCLF